MEYRLDLSAYRCPLPLLMIKKALKSLKTGDELIVIVSAETDTKDILLLCRGVNKSQSGVSLNTVCRKLPDTPDAKHRLAIQLQAV